MGKRIIQQRRGHASNTYRVKEGAFKVRVAYPRNLSGEWEVVDIFSTPGHTIPVAKLSNGKDFFYNFATNFLYVGQKIKIGGTNPGDISRLGDLRPGMKIFNIEHVENDGGKFVRTGGNCAEILDKSEESVKVLLPSKKEHTLSLNCRATVGVAAGDGRLEKPILKAGKKYYIMKSKSKLWPRTSAVKMNKIDHPFGSGRGKNIKSKIAKRNAPPGKKVGLIRPRRTGRRKR